MLLARCIPVVITDSGGLELEGSQVQVPAVLQDARVSWRLARRATLMPRWRDGVCVYLGRAHQSKCFQPCCMQKDNGPQSGVSRSCLVVFLVFSRMMMIFYPDGRQMFTRAFINPYKHKNRLTVHSGP